MSACQVCRLCSNQPHSLHVKRSRNCPGCLLSMHLSGRIVKGHCTAGAQQAVDLSVCRAYLAVGRGGELHLVGDVARGHALEQLGEDGVGVLEALGVFGLADAVVALLVLLRAQLAAAEVVNEVDLRPHASLSASCSKGMVLMTHAEGPESRRELNPSAQLHASDADYLGLTTTFHMRYLQRPLSWRLEGPLQGRLAATAGAHARV